MTHAHLRRARIPIDPRPGDFLVVGDDEIEPALAEVLSRKVPGHSTWACFRDLRRATPSSTVTVDSS